MGPVTIDVAAKDWKEYFQPLGVYGKEVDWWAFGVILYSLLTKGYTPFDSSTNPQRFRLIAKGYSDNNDHADRWLKRSSCSTAAKELVRSLLRDNENYRWNATHK